MSGGFHAVTTSLRESGLRRIWVSTSAIWSIAVPSGAGQERHYEIVSSERNADSDYTATCRDGNRYRVYVDGQGRVVVQKL
jgi:hypothetical protein